MTGVLVAGLILVIILHLLGALGTTMMTGKPRKAFTTGMTTARTCVLLFYAVVASWALIYVLNN